MEGHQKVVDLPASVAASDRFLTGDVFIEARVEVDIDRAIFHSLCPYFLS